MVKISALRSYKIIEKQNGGVQVKKISKFDGIYLYINSKKIICDNFLITSNKSFNFLTKINDNGVFDDKTGLYFHPKIIEKEEIIPNF